MDTVVDNLELLKVVACGNSKAWGLAMHLENHPLISGYFHGLAIEHCTWTAYIFSPILCCQESSNQPECPSWSGIVTFVINTILPHCAPSALLILAISKDIRTPLRFPVNAVPWVPSASSPICSGQATRNPGLCISQEEWREGICLIPQ